MKSPGTAISEGQIGRLAGNMTERAFGVRISIHRVRDNVATEAAEHIQGGSRAAATLLRHQDVATTARYDHSEGVHAAEAFGAYVMGERSKGVDLDI